jgi:hypothetical protein
VEKPFPALALESGRADFPAALAYCLAVAGRTDEVESLLDETLEAGDRVPPIAPAMILIGLGRASEAKGFLEQCHEGRDWHLLLMVNAPLMKAQVADDPELRAF